jgi:NAD(P)-dependent dehydrogenase (short-subunit alcohol dehydrogenase family)
MEFQSRIALVTGAGSGIGLAIARALVTRGARVVIVGRRVALLDALAAELADRALPLVLDVTDEAAVGRAFAVVQEHWGVVSILVNNAGAASSAALAQETLDRWLQLMAVNATGPFLCTRAALPGMITQGWGRVVNIASTAALAGARYISAYAASKHALLGMTRCVALEVARHGVTVNAICPGYVATELTDAAVANIMERTGLDATQAQSRLAATSAQRRLLEPDEIAAAVIYLCSEGARGVNGQALMIDGGGGA